MSYRPPTVTRHELRSLVHHIRTLANIAAGTLHPHAQLAVKKALVAAAKTESRHGMKP